VSDLARIAGFTSVKKFYVFRLIAILCLLSGINDLYANSKQSWGMQTARTIALAMFAYANDHDGRYPDGASSTEVFQELLDEGYIYDPIVLYLQIPGKIQGSHGQKLKPENVCFDLTAGVDAKAPDGLPLVFVTGYKINYRPGSTALPLQKPRTWAGWWNGDPKPFDFPEGLAVAYKGNTARSLPLDFSARPEGSISNFIPPDLAVPPDGAYHQLTPDGPPGFKEINEAVARLLRIGLKRSELPKNFTRGGGVEGRDGPWIYNNDNDVAIMIKFRREYAMKEGPNDVIEEISKPQVWGRGD
jgi:hypothetical protein